MWQLERPRQAIHRRGNQSDQGTTFRDVLSPRRSTYNVNGMTRMVVWLVWWYGSLQFATVSVDTRNEMVCNPFEQVRSL
ncbi:hypothetical protein SUGI_0367110 [Cryptomeria japonica]|nr:hypothetical protein SUGI_0367110 [Cryptomeria japonica]